jgi:hypothetical protein
MKVVKLKAEHVRILKQTEAVSYLKDFSTDATDEALANQEYAFAFLTDAGELKGAAGVVQYWPGRGEAWAIFNSNCGTQDFLQIHTITKKFLADCPVKRIEATVEFDFVNGHRWIQALGFICEAPLMRAYGPKGNNFSMYSKVRA